VRSESEVRIGGAWTIAFGSTPEGLYRHRHVFDVIDRPRRLLLSTTERRLDASTLRFETEFTFEACGDGRLLTMIQRGLQPTSGPSMPAASRTRSIGSSDSFTATARIIRRRSHERQHGAGVAGGAQGATSCRAGTEEHAKRVVEQRRELPWVPVEREYRFATEDGPRSLLELFEGRSQLLIYHLMFGEDWAGLRAPAARQSPTG